MVNKSLSWNVRWWQIMLPPDFLLLLRRKNLALFSIEIADDQVDRVITAMCVNYNYNSQISNPDYDPSLEVEEGEDYDPATNPETLDNPETSYSFANRMVREYLINNTQAYEIQQLKANAVSAMANNPTISDPSV